MKAIKPVIIVCIVGLSGSGKTTASFILRKQFGWNVICSYATRPIRSEETDGVEHHFVTPNDTPSCDEMCAYTKFGGYEYWTTWSQFSLNTPNVYVIDEKGLIDLKSKENNAPFPFKVFTIYLKREDLSAISNKRKERDCERVSISSEWYDYSITNNHSIENLKTQLYLVGQCIKQKID